MPGSIIEGRRVAESRTLMPDFCIIGSGASGGVCAALSLLSCKG